MLNFIVLVEVLIGYFRNSILAYVRVLQTEKHTGSTCVCADLWEKIQGNVKRIRAWSTLG